MTYLVNHHIFSEASIEIKNMQDRAIGQKQKSGIYFSYVALGNLNALEGLRDVAAEYYEKAIGYYEENDGDLDQLSLSAVYSNLSGCYIALERYSEAEKTLVKALETTKADSFLVNLCLLYEKQGDWDKLYETLSSVDFGKSMASATKDKFYRSYALYHSQQKEFSKAVEYASQMQSPESYSVLADVYKLKGDFENALKYREVADSIENASLLALQKTQLAETDRIFDHNRIFQEEVERRQKRNIIIIAILAFALLSVAVVSQIVQRRRKKVALILQKEHEKTLLADHHKSVFIKNMTHEMMTPLNHISGFSQLMTDENLDKDTMLEYARIVDDGARHMSRIFDNISIVASKLDELDDLSEEESVLYHINEEGER